MGEETLTVTVEVPIPDDEDPYEYAKRVASWSITTLDQGRIRAVEL